MNILGIDTCSRITNIGLINENGLRDEISLDLKRRQSEQLPEITASLLEKNGLSFKDIVLIGVTNGPGFYTGIRTGLSYAASLAYALNIKIVPLHSLNVMAQPYTEAYDYVVSVIKARKKSLYYAIYDKNGVIQEPQYSKLEKLLAELEGLNNICVVGSDYAEYEELKELEGVHYISELKTGIATAQLAGKYASEAKEAYEVKAEYLRNPDIGPVTEE